MNYITELEYIYSKMYLSFFYQDLDLTRISEIWKLIGYQNKISNKDLKVIMEMSSNIKSLYNKSYNILTEGKKELESTNFLNETSFKFYSTLLNINLEKINGYKKWIIDKISSINVERSLKLKRDYYSNQNKKTKVWVYELVEIYLKLGGSIPIDTHSFFMFIKRNWNDIHQRDKDFIIYCCEDILGGNKLEWISQNLKTWIINYSDDINLKNDLVPINYNVQKIADSPSLKSKISPKVEIFKDDLEFLEI